MASSATLASAPSAPAQGTHRRTSTFLVLFLVACVPYANTLFNQFVYDDGFQVVGNPYAHSFKYLRQIFTTTVWSFLGAQGVSNYYRPMMTLGYLLTYQVAGLTPFTYHLVNVLLNGIVVWLVFAILRRLSGERVALIAAGLFALHPIHTEPVAWIAAVTDLELAVFYLATFLLYLKLPDAGNKSLARAAMCGCFILALLSKEQAMTLPVLALLYEHFYRDDRSSTTSREKLSRYGALWIIAALYFAIRIVAMRGLAKVVMRPNLSWYSTGLSAVVLLGKYLGKLVWPARLSPYYIFEASTRLTEARVLLGFAALIACLLLFAAMWKRARPISFALVWIFLPLGPVLNARWMPSSVFGDRYLYLPSLGFCWIVAWGAVQVWSSGRLSGTPRVVARAVPAALGILALVYGVHTVARNRDWRNNEALYRKIIETEGDASLIRGNLGSLAYDRGDLQQAERDWLDALASGPTNVHALDSMAMLRRGQNRYSESLDYSAKALKVRPVDTFVHVDFGVTLAALGRTADAEDQFRTAVSLAPLSTTAHNTYGKFLYLQGRTEEARAEFERSADADFSADAYDGLGDIGLGMQDLPRAEKAFRAAFAGNPSDSHAHYGLGRTLEFSGRTAEALLEYDRSLAADPTDAAAKAAVDRLLPGASPQPQAQ
jgi:tetratricopeptide (TPR) repeat protein